MRALHTAARVALLSALFATGCPRADSGGKAAPAPAAPSPAARFVGLYEVKRGRGEDARVFTLRIKAVSPEGQVECEAAADDGELRASPGGRLTTTGMLTVVIEGVMQPAPVPPTEDALDAVEPGSSLETWTVDAELASDGTLEGEVRIDTPGGSRVQPITGSLLDE